MKTLTRDNYKKIHDIACSTWKPKLQDLFGCEFAINDEIQIDRRIHKTMRDACTDEQHILFDEIFGKDEEENLLNTWYKSKDTPKWMLYFTEEGGYYGFGTNGNWVNRETRDSHPNDAHNKKKYYKATEEEVKSALIKEATKRGFREGVRVQCLADSQQGVLAKKLNFIFDELGLYAGNEIKGKTMILCVSLTMENGRK